MAKNNLIPKQLEDLTKCSALGMDTKHIAQHIKYPYQKLLYLVKFDEAVQDAIEAGEAKATQGVLSALLKKAMEGDLGAIKYWLKNRTTNWNDDHKLELGGSVGVESAITPDAMLRVARTYVKLHGGGEETTGVGDVGETDNG